MLFREFDERVQREFRASLPFVAYAPARFARATAIADAARDAPTRQVTSYAALLSAIAAPDGVGAVDLSGTHFAPKEMRELTVRCCFALL